MRILAVYRHYWPDATPYARLLRALLEHAAASGRSATAYSAQPAYNGLEFAAQPARERLGGVAVRRIALLPERRLRKTCRLINNVYFLLRAACHVLRRRDYDLLLANGHPPVLMGCMLRVVSALTGIPYVLHLQDIHPEGAAAIGRVRPGRRFALLQRLDAWACRGAARLATLSEDMADTLRARGGALPPIDVINNAPLRIDAPATASLPAPLQRAPDCPLLLFAGNVGEFQGLDRLVLAAVQLARRRRFRLTFLGAGAARERLQRLAGDELGRSIAFVPHMSPEAAAAAMAQADYGVVSLHEGVYRCAFPSKSMMYLSVGCPLLTLVEPESELARTVRTADLGCTADGLSEQQVYDALDRACAAAARWTPAERVRLQAAGERLYGERRMLAAWASVFEQAAAVSPGLRRGAADASSGREAA